jgi:hypothetical protein
MFIVHAESIGVTAPARVTQTGSTIRPDPLLVPET